MPMAHRLRWARIALGRNILIGFMTWEGYNYEDAVLISEELVRNDVYTSIHIEKHEIEARDTKLGQEEITSDIPNVGDDALKDLDERGIIRIGAEVRTGDYTCSEGNSEGKKRSLRRRKAAARDIGEKGARGQGYVAARTAGETNACGVKVFTARE